MFFVAITELGGSILARVQGTHCRCLWDAFRRSISSAIKNRTAEWTMALLGGFSNLFLTFLKKALGLPCWLRWQRICLQCRRAGFYPWVLYSWVGKIPWQREWQPTPVFLPGEFHGQRSLVCTWTENFQMFKLDLEKAEESEIKLPTSIGWSKEQESSRKTSTSVLLTMPKPLTMWITTNCGKCLKRWEY